MRFYRLKSTRADEHIIYSSRHVFLSVEIMIVSEWTIMMFFNRYLSILLCPLRSRVFFPNGAHYHRYTLSVRTSRILSIALQASYMRRRLHRKKVQKEELNNNWTPTTENEITSYTDISSDQWTVKKSDTSIIMLSAVWHRRRKNVTRDEIRWCSCTLFHNPAILLFLSLAIFYKTFLYDRVQRTAIIAYILHIGPKRVLRAPWETLSIGRDTINKYH